MKKSTYVSLIVGGLLGCLLGEMGYSIATLTFWGVIILAGVAHHLIYYNCKPD